MRYYYEQPERYLPIYGQVYFCHHPVYTRCTLFKDGETGMAVIQQRFDRNTKKTWWTEIDEWLANSIYINLNFSSYYSSFAGRPIDGLYPTVTIRQLMWALRMKPLKRERWETVFDHKPI